MSWDTARAEVVLPRIKPLARNVAAPVPPEGTVRAFFKVRVSIRVEVALRVGMRASAAAMRVLLIRRVESNVEEALIKIPAVVEVGVSALVNRVSQAPGDPLLPAPALAQNTLPLISVVKVPPLSSAKQFSQESFRLVVMSAAALTVVVAACSFKVLALERKISVSPPSTRPVEEAVAPVCWARPPTYRESVVVAELNVPPPVSVILPLLLLTTNSFTPDPFWMVKAVVDEMFMSSPPLAVNPERKLEEELTS